MTVRIYKKAKTDDGVTDRDGQGSTKLRRKSARNLPTGYKRFES
jgi:hypothetical protein